MKLCIQIQRQPGWYIFSEYLNPKSKAAINPLNGFSNVRFRQYLSSLQDVLGPAQLLQANCVIPDFCHVLYTPTVKNNVVDVIGRNTISCRFYRPARSRLSTVKYGNRRHRLICFISREEFQFVVPVRNWSKEIFHPLGVSLQSGNVG